MDPDSGASITDAELLAIADEEITGELFPLLRSLDSGFYLHNDDHSITADQSRYKIAARATEQIADVLYVDSQGNEESLSVMPIEDRGLPSRWAGAASVGSGSGTGRYTAYPDGDFVGLVPTPSTTQGTLRIRYYRAPGSLTLVANARIVSALTSATRLTLTADPTGLFSIGDDVDIVNAGNSHQVLDPDRDVTAVAANYLDFLAYSSEVAVGDYVTAAGTTAIVPLPDVMAPLLIQRVKAALLDALGDERAWMRSQSMIQTLEANVRTMLKPRFKADPKYVVGRGGAWRGDSRRRLY